MLAGHVNLGKNKQLLEVVISIGENMTGCGHVGSLDKRDGRMRMKKLLWMTNVEKNLSKMFAYGENRINHLCLMN